MIAWVKRELLGPVKWAIDAIIERIECERLAVEIAMIAQLDRAWVRHAVRHAYRLASVSLFRGDTPSRLLRGLLTLTEQGGRVPRSWMRGFDA